MRRAVGEGIEPSRSGYYHVSVVFHDLRHRDKEVCLPKISPSYSIYITNGYAVGEGFEPSQSG
jgi:hypothetical protein